jgi:type I restriction enzyme, S subunit
MRLRKDSWRQVKFNEVSYCKEKHSKNPFDDGLTRFVGLENLNGETGKIQGFGKIEDGTTFTKVFSKGDILFGKRRVYLRKVAVADFDGICSGDILVFKSKNDVILEELLPLIVTSPSFTDYAISNSSGSLSPRTKWKHLANYEFSLPPLSDQKQIAALFLSLEAAVERLEEQEGRLKGLWKRLIDDFVSEEPKFGDLLKSKRLQTVIYKDVAKKMMKRIDPVSYGVERIVAGENLESEDYKIRTWQTVGEGYLGPAFHVLFQPGDILYGSRRTYLRKVALADFEGVCANTTYVIRSNESLLFQGLLKHVMLSERFTQYSIGVSKGSTNPYINWSDLDNFTFQIPEIETQKEIIKMLDSIWEIIEHLKTQKTRLQELKRGLLEEILG